jgi:hypothetical protein
MSALVTGRVIGRGTAKRMVRAGRLSRFGCQLARNRVRQPVQLTVTNAVAASQRGAEHFQIARAQASVATDKQQCARRRVAGRSRQACSSPKNARPRQPPGKRGRAIAAVPPEELKGVQRLPVNEFPKVDLWLCRDCLFHLSNRDILLALRNFLASGTPLVFTTTHLNSAVFENVDIRTGGFRRIDLFSAP